MKEGWKIQSLGAVCEFQNGFAFKSNTFCETGVGVVRISDIQNGEVSTKKMMYVDPHRINEDLSGFIVRPNDILIAMSGGTTGKLGINKTNREFFQNQRVGLFREHKEILNHKFLFYFLQTKSEESLRIAAGAAQPNLSTAQIKGFEIPIPSLPEQERIVKILDAAFEKIDRLKENAEKGLQAVKDLWQATLREELKPKEGWKSNVLRDICIEYGEYGMSVPSKEYDGVRYLRITDIKDNGDLNEELVSADIEKIDDHYILRQGDLLFARTGATVGKTLLYKEEYGKCSFAGYLIRYRANQEIILPKFLFYITHSEKYYKWVQENQKAAAQPNISAKLYNSYCIYYPSIEEQKNIIGRLDKLMIKYEFIQQNLVQELSEYETLKLSILRKAFSGEL